MIGYKMMTLKEETGMIHSMADSRLSIKPQRGEVVFPGWMWLGTSIEYVQQYYGSFDPEDPEEMDEGEYEVRCTFEYNESEITHQNDFLHSTGGLGTEFSVSRAILISAYNVTKKEVIF